MRLALFMIASSCLFAQAPYRSLQGASGKYGTATLPNTTPWTNMTQVRIEFRLHDWTSTGRILDAGSLLCSKNAGNITCTSFYDSGSPAISTTIPASQSDVIVRVQWNTTMWTIESWAATGATYNGGQFVAATVSNISLNNTPLDVLHNGSGGSTGVPAGLAWLRVYSTTVARDSAMPTNITGGNLLDYEFEGGGTDSSPTGLNLTMTGSPTYPSTPVVPIVGEELTVRSNSTFTPTCAGTNADSYKWRQQGAPPLSVSFSSATASAPTVTWNAGFGQYSLTCEATINGVKGVTSLTIGSVATNAAGVVVVPDSTIGLMLGDMLAAGVQEWAWAERNRRTMGDYWIADTVNYTNAFTSTEAQNYYDSCLAQYQNYYRTGLTRFQTAARACADKWYSQIWAAQATAGTCGASNWLAPRNASIQGLMIRAYETGELAGGLKWTCYTAYANYYFDLYVEQRGTDNGYTSPYFGLRESGYAFMAATGIAVAHPTPATRTAYAARLVTEMTNYARGLQCLTGTTRFECTNAYTTGAGTISASNGSAIITGSGTGFLSFFTAGQSIAFYDGADSNKQYVIQSVDSNTQVTLTTPMVGTGTSGELYAKAVASTVLNGGYRYESGDASLFGYGDIVWHSGIFMEAMVRIYRAAIETTLTASVIQDYGNYVLTNAARITPAFTCTGSFGNLQARRVVYSNYYANGDTGTGCSSDTDIQGQRQQNDLAVDAYGMTYLLGASAPILAAGDNLWSAMMGEWIGTGADGQYGMLTSTSSNGKFYGQSCRNWQYLVHRLGSTNANITPVSASVSVSYTLTGAPPSAAKMRATVTLPNGTTAATTCTSSPCTVTGLDTRQGTAAQMREA
ncbi:MAG: hypothetical protein EBR82_07155 [Caulobacteraceae bacterium]|nr:hypothetical protein [Caulobacteraceae bacterium]